MHQGTDAEMCIRDRDERRPGAMYPRCICLAHNGEKNGTLLATFECYSHGTPVFPIYESNDDGESWHRLSEIRDEEKGFGCRFQPHLLELPVTCGCLLYTSRCV